MRLTENELRLIIRESLEEGRFADFMRGVGKHGSKILTRPAGIIAKVFGRLATSGDTSGFESRIDANVEGLEELIGDLIHLPSRGAEVGYEEIKKMVKKYKPDATDTEISDLEAEIEKEKSKQTNQPSQRASRKAPRAKRLSRPVGTTRQQIAAEARIRRRLKRL